MYYSHNVQGNRYHLRSPKKQNKRLSFPKIDKPPKRPKNKRMRVYNDLGQRAVAEAYPTFFAPKRDLLSLSLPSPPPPPLTRKKKSCSGTLPATSFTHSRVWSIIISSSLSLSLSSPCNAISVRNWQICKSRRTWLVQGE